MWEEFVCVITDQNHRHLFHSKNIYVASIFFGYLWSFCWPNFIVTLPRYFSFRLPHLNIPTGSPADEFDKNSQRTWLSENLSHQITQQLNGCNWHCHWTLPHVSLYQILTRLFYIGEWTRRIFLSENTYRIVDSFYEIIPSFLYIWRNPKQWFWCENMIWLHYISCPLYNIIT